MIQVHVNNKNLLKLLDAGRIYSGFVICGDLIEKGLQCEKMLDKFPWDSQVLFQIAQSLQRIITREHEGELEYLRKCVILFRTKLEELFFKVPQEWREGK